MFLLGSVPQYRREGEMDKVAKRYPLISLFLATELFTVTHVIAKSLFCEQYTGKKMFIWTVDHKSFRSTHLSQF